ncbi:MAG: Holliday junction branch migration protein RuvA [Dehalococcoidia bacterium]|jgi:Holliday junction DNA helicase RuvA
MSAVARIWGVVEDVGAEGITIRIDGTGLGLLVQVPGHTRDALGVPGREVSLYTHLQARESDVALYGFATTDELRLFHLLIGVSGVGPKGALALLTGLPGDSIWEAIANSDVERIRSAPGIGAKTASRIIIDLKGRLPEHLTMGVPAASLLSADDEVIAALVSLGYTQAEASAAASRLPSDGSLSLEEKIRLALSSFSSQ